MPGSPARSSSVGPPPGSPSSEDESFEPDTKRARKDFVQDNQDKLDQFLQMALNRPLNDNHNPRTLAVLTSENLFNIAQSTLPELNLSLEGTDMRLEEQEPGPDDASMKFHDAGVQLTFSMHMEWPPIGPPTTLQSAPSAPGPFRMQVILHQSPSQDDAAIAIENHIRSYQRLWAEVFKKTNGKFGNYALSTSNSVFWTRWSTFTIIELEHIAQNVQRPPSADEMSKQQEFNDDILGRVALAFDQAFLSARGTESEAPSSSVENFPIPEMKVGEPVELSMRFQRGAAKVKGVEFDNPEYIMVGGDIDENGQLSLVGLKAGSTWMRISVIHEATLKVKVREFRLKVRN
ncbi:hypothetical protein Micbo1qcDRAFT_178638 [Microdochium bolleyi]|uniref:Uncharacterized protein n=1 Tax=Microdochium bolleyi TaxID=196109 RepID=A0A136IT19_9PEZI|nr:hypothetical protein Micbo1qcDRAFT_178638 [Microdochium bolleyi]